ncbi:MAG: MBL fold metallo-hydrolase [Stellaceae bacterium]
MFDLVFLGTSAAVPSAERGSPALYVGHGPDRFLIDCGEGTQRQLMRARLGFRGLRHVLLTHAHLDHIGGLPGLVATRALYGIEQPIEIVGSAETIGYIGHYLALTVGREPSAGYRLHAVEPGRVQSWPGWRLDAFAVQHRGTQSLGYRFAEDSRSPLLPERLAALGVPDGPERRELAEGRPVTLPDSRVITPDMVQGPPGIGAKLVVIGDVEEIAELTPQAQGADALVIEATYLESDAALARSHGHLIAAAAASLARNAEVGELLMQHISGRYPAEAILAEAAKTFPRARVVADFDRISIRAGHGRQAPRIS